MIKDINDNAVEVGSIVSLRTICHWNGCSGQVSRLEDNRYEPLVIVTMPDKVTVMAFQPSEIEVR